MWRRAPRGLAFSMVIEPVLSAARGFVSTMVRCGEMSARAAAEGLLSQGLLSEGLLLSARGQDSVWATSLPWAPARLRLHLVDGGCLKAAR